jgi:hypothetical protein
VRIAASTGKFNAFVEHGMGRDAIEMKELKGSETKCNRHRFGESLIWSLKQRLDAGIERDLPAKSAENKRHCQIAIFRRKFYGMRGMNKVVAIALPDTNKRKNVEGGCAGGRDWLGNRF